VETKTVLVLWKKLSSCIADEISNNEEFSKKIGALFEGVSSSTVKPKKSNRRTPSKIDPFILYDQGSATLKTSLETLNIEELKDVIATNGMDTARLAMKWKDRDRIINHIIEMTQRRSSHGDAFWNNSKDNSVETE
jgi:hypothetical protein